INSYWQIESGQFLLKNQLLYKSGATPAILPWPAEPNPATIIQALMPLRVALPEQIFADLFSLLCGEGRWLVCFQPFPHLHPVSFLLWRVVKIHRLALSGLARTTEIIGRNPT